MEYPSLNDLLLDAIDHRPNPESTNVSNCGRVEIDLFAGNAAAGRWDRRKRSLNRDQSR